MVRPQLRIALVRFVCASLVSMGTVPALASSDELRDEFHQTYTVQPGARVSLENINGAVHITSWDRDEVKVDAVKTAYKKERLDEARIEVDASASHVSIRTHYPGHDMTFNSGDRDNPARVEYTVTVPRGAELDEIKLVNGPLDITNVAGEVRASCVNGKLLATGLSGRAHLSSVNGKLEAAFSSVSKSIQLESVNGHVEVTLPSDVNADVEANTVSGGISNDFGLSVNSHMVGHDLRGKLGSGGTTVRLQNVNGGISIKHAADGHALSPAKDMGGDHDRAKDDKDDDDDDKDEL